MVAAATTAGAEPGSSSAVSAWSFWHSRRAAAGMAGIAGARLPLFQTRGTQQIERDQKVSNMVPALLRAAVAAE